jgi:succinate dehydrogenase/fumarate reductase flavoprotein subunit
MSSDYGVIDAKTIPGWADEADVVIVGLGCAGVCAAIEAREAGADVLVLERASGGGGVTSMAAGHVYLGGGTRVQKAVGIEDSVEDMYTYLIMNTPEPDEAKIRSYCEDSVEHFDWLVAQGVPFNDTMFQGKHVMQMTDECLIWSGNEEVHPFRDKAKPAPRGHKVAQPGEGGGAKMMEILIKRAEGLGIRVVYDAHVTGIVMEDDRVIGVGYRVFGEGKGAVLGRNGVILATGHFTENEGLLEEYLPELLVDGYTLQYTPYDDGAGHILGKCAGGALKHMDGALVTAAFYPPESHIKGILVNKEGKRYVAEDSYHSRSSLFTTKQTDRTGYLILDDVVYTPDPPAWGAQPLIDAFESIEEMEKGLGLPEGSLRKTMADYNEHAAKGEDPEFHKKAKWLQPLTNPPFAALDTSVGAATYMAFTLGGLDVSIDGEVMNEDGEVISGLYAVGACASNIAQDGTGYSSGTCIGESSFFGRRAGRRVVQG